MLASGQECWIANLASKKLPLSTLQGLRKQVKFREYPEFEAELLRSPDAKLMFGDALKGDGQKSDGQKGDGQKGETAAPAAAQTLQGAQTL
jgi:hypothetical protein